MADESAKEDIYGEDYGLMTETINYILAAADFPKSYHAYLYCLIAIANEQIKFEASDLDVSIHARAIGGNVDKEITKGWARDNRRALMKWQDEKNITLVEVVPGKRGERGRKDYIKSSFKLYLVEYAKEVISEAKSIKVTRFGNRTIALRKAANNLIKKLSSQPIITKDTRPFDPPTEVRKNLRTARTNLMKAIHLLEKYNFKLQKFPKELIQESNEDLIQESDEELIQEIEKYIEAIKNRGYVENILDIIIFDGIVDDNKP